MSTRLSAAAGAAIRRLRQARGWTLAELGARSGVPLSSLSKVELGQTSLGYDVLIRLCAALEVDVEHLIRAQAAPDPTQTKPTGRRAVVRAGEGDSVDLGGLAGLSAAGDLLRRDFTPVVLEVRDTERTGGLLRAPGDAYLLVLNGAVVMHSDVYAPLVLRRGDGVFFDGQMGFALTAETDWAAQALFIHQGERVSEA